MTDAPPRAPLCDRLPAVLAVVGGLLVLLAFYPGYMSNDSFSQMDQARTGIIGDNHPALLVGFWVLAEWLVVGPFVMLLAQVALFWSGLLRFARVAFPDRPGRSAAIVLMGFYPPVFGILGTLWKDVWMTGLLLWTVALTLAYLRHSRRSAGAGALLAMTLAISMRHNALAAVLPCAVALVWCVMQVRRPSVGAVRRAGVAGVAGLVMVGVMFTATSWASSKVVDLHGHFWQVVADYDLAGISTAVGEDLFPEGRLRPGATVDDVALAYSPRSLLPLYRSPCAESVPSCRELIIQSRDGAERELDALKRAWVEAVTSHPVVYARHRLAVFRELIGVTDEPVWAPYYADRFAQELDVASPQAPLSRAVDGVLRVTSTTPLYWVWLYGLALMALVGWTVREVRAGRDAWALGLVSTSGLLYLLSYLPIAPSPDYRYSQWTVLVTMMGAVTLARGNGQAAS